MGIKFKIGIILLVVILILVSMIILYLSLSKKNVFETDNVNYYKERNDKHLKYLSLFPETIPDCTTANYHYYKYFATTEDEFLELQFPNEDELSNFCEMILSKFDSNEIIERTNPYDNRYTEYFWGRYAASTGQENAKRFFQVEYVNEEYITAHFHSLCISEDKKTVIITYITGKFHTNSYVPKYLEYFNVPINEELHDEIVFVNLSKQE